jgi:hypothetical protein
MDILAPFREYVAEQGELLDDGELGLELQEYLGEDFMRKIFALLNMEEMYDESDEER